jgi:nitrogen regulatory protein P-II 1
MKKIEAIIRPTKLEPLKDALTAVDVKGMTISQVKGFGNQYGWKEYFRGSEILVNLLPKVKFEIVTTDDRVQEIVDIIIATARTGEVGDGKIFIYPLEEVIRIRTGERSDTAI